MANLSQAELAQLVAEVIKALGNNGTAPKAAPVASPVDKLALRDAAIRAGFARRGIKNVTLMNRADPKADFDVRPFKGWLELVLATFHISSRARTHATGQGGREAARTLLDNARNCYLRTKGALTAAGQCKHLKLFVVAGPTSPTSLIFQDDCFVAFTAWTAENCVCYGCSEPYASCHCGLQQTSDD